MGWSLKSAPPFGTHLCLLKIIALCALVAANESMALTDGGEVNLVTAAEFTWLKACVEKKRANICHKEVAASYW